MRILRLTLQERQHQGRIGWTYSTYRTTLQLYRQHSEMYIMREKRMIERITFRWT
jgi:hypothetical protein